MIEYSKIKNKWVKVNYKMLETVRKQIVQYAMAGGAYEGHMSLEALVKIFDMLIVEIERLENLNREVLNISNAIKMAESIVDPVVEKLQV